MGKIATGALLMCSVLVLVAVAPLAQSEDTVHVIWKWENGPPSTCDVSWTFEAPSDGTWTGHVVDENEDMRWIILHVEEVGGAVLVDRDMYRFAVYGYDFSTAPVSMVGGHSYEITVTPNCPLGAECTMEDVFEGVGPIPPVAVMDVTIDYLSVSVDGSASYDDGSIVDYQWDFGDGSTASGVTATHEYEVPTVPYVAPGNYGDPTAPPYSVLGYTRNDQGQPLPYCTVIITNDDTGKYVVIESDGDGFYICDVFHAIELQVATGQWITVKAVSGTLSGEASGQVDMTNPMFPYLWLDVELVEGPIEPFQMTITLTVEDNDGEFSSVSETITLPGA